MYGGDASARNVILQDAPTGGWEAITKVKLPQGDEYEQAGLIAHNSDANVLEARADGHPGPRLARRSSARTSTGQPIFDESLDRSGPLPASINESGIWLQLAEHGRVPARRRGRPTASDWTPFGRSRSQTTQRIGLAAYNGNGQAAAFDFFRIEPKDVRSRARPARRPRPATGCCSTGRRRA